MTRADYLFLLSALLGLGAALAMALGFVNQWRTGGIAAWVNGESVSEERYASALLAMQGSLRRELTAEDRRNALRTVIDEELILQEALTLGLARNDAVARKNLIQSLLTQATSVETPQPADDQTLRAFFERNKNLFAPPVRVNVRVLQAENSHQAETFAEAIRQGRPFADTGRAQNLQPLSLPADLPLERVARYIGAEAIATLKQMATGDIAGPLKFGDGFIFIWLTAKAETSLSYEQIAGQVRAEWTRRQQEQAFAEYLRALRQAAHIRIVVSTDEPYL